MQIESTRRRSQPDNDPLKEEESDEVNKKRQKLKERMARQA